MPLHSDLSFTNDLVWPALSRSRQWREGYVARAPLGDASACSVILLDPQTALSTQLGNCDFVLSVQATSIACLSVLGGGSLLCGSS